MSEIYRPEAEALVWDQLLDGLAVGDGLNARLFEIKETYGITMRDRIETRIASVLLAHPRGPKDPLRSWPLRPEAQPVPGPAKVFDQEETRPLRPVS